MSANINNQDQSYKKPSAGAIIGGALAGSAVQGLVLSPHKIISPKISKNMENLSNTLTNDEFKKVNDAIENAMETSGLKDKGVDVIKATTDNSNKIKNIISEEMNNGIAKYYPKAFKEQIASTNQYLVKQGKNAFYTFKSKKIIMPENRLSLAFFHEAGHAMNANLSKLGKILQKCRPMALLAIPVSLIALWKTKKAPGEEPKNGLDRITTFIKNNAGKLTFLAFLPTLLEEGLASVKGNKLAKKLLSPELAKKVAKTNALGFSSYALLATLSGLGVYLGTKVKDAIASKKLVEQNN